MKKLLIASLFLLGGSSLAYAAGPTILFSDITSGPKTGGQNDKGAFVTVVGRNFGASRGNSSVSVGGGQADNYPVWTDTKITFQLGPNAASGPITVTTAGGTSNGIGFTVRSGNIYFVSAASPNSPGSGTFADPWRSPASYFSAMKPGDICYIRAGTYTGQYGSGTRPYNISFYNRGAPSGSLNNEIAWIGYPGETAYFKADNDAGAYNGILELTSGVEYYVFAGLSMYGRGDGRGQVRLFSNNNKFVNNKVEGIKTLSYGMIEVNATQGTTIWGNELFGATSGNKLDHILYVQGGSDNIDFGWNYIHDNNIAVGPIISIHQDGGSGSSQNQNIRIHDNLVDSRNTPEPARFVGMVETAPGSSCYIYNNTVIGAGSSNSYNHGIYIYSGSVFIYNNTFYQTKGNNSYAIYITNAFNPERVEIKNNIFYNASGCGYISNSASGMPFVVENNLYYGGTGTPPAADAGKITADPLFVNAAANNFRLSVNSPCIDKGVNTTSVVQRDADGFVRAAGFVDMGAYEYGEQSAVQDTAAVSGRVRDADGNGVAGVTLTLSGSASGSAVTAEDGSYTLNGIPVGGACTVTPSRTGMTFEPASFSADTLNADVNSADFTATSTVTLYSVKGYVRNGAGAGVAGVALALAGDMTGTVTTATDGSYQFSGLPEGGSYTITPAKTDSVFSPVVSTIANLSANIAGRNFTATPLFSISGYLKTTSGTGIAGVTVTLSGGSTKTVVTSDDGFYQFTGLAGGMTYAVTPKLKNWKFTPLTLSLTSLQSNLADRNFIGKRTYAIRGYVRDNKGGALRSVRMTLNGGEMLSTITGEDGYYEFLDLAEESPYTVTSDLSGYEFEPNTRSTSTLAGYIEGWDFEGMYMSSIMQGGQVTVMGSSTGRGTVNPDKGESSRIYFKGSETGTFECRIFTLAGEKVFEETKQNVQEGTFEWVPRSMASGIYVAYVKGPGITAKKKIAVVR